MAEEAQLERLRRHIAVLTSDKKKQSSHYSLTRDSTKSIKGKLFGTKDVSLASVRAFLTYCIFPRCLISPDDALYCSRFVELLHALGTPGFSTMNYIDQLIEILASALYCVTEVEAATMGIVLLETWRLVSTWRYDEDAFQAEVVGKVSPKSDNEF
jgi:THO complex subunit 2